MKSSFTVQRSEEICPDEVRHLVKQTSSISSDGDGSQEGDRFIYFWFISLSENFYENQYVDSRRPNMKVLPNKNFFTKYQVYQKMAIV